MKSIKFYRFDVKAIGTKKVACNIPWKYSQKKRNVIKAVWHRYIFPKYYSCVSLIILNCFLAAAQSKLWVKNLSLYNSITLSLYNLMVAKMIDELEIAYMSFCPSYTVIMELDAKKKSRRKIGTREWLLKWNKRGAYNEILNELRLNKF